MSDPIAKPAHFAEAQQHVHSLIEEASRLAKKLFGEASTPDHAFQIVNLILDIVQSQQRSGKSDAFAEALKALADHVVKPSAAG